VHTLGVHPIHKQFWQYPLCNVYRLWLPDELRQLLLGLVKDLLHWLLKYRKARQVKFQFHNRFTSVPRYPGLQHFSKQFDSLKSDTWQGKGMCGMIRTLALNRAPFLACSKDDGNTVVDTASDEIILAAVRALCDFSVLFSQQNRLDISLKELDNALKRWYQRKRIFQEQKMSNSAKTKKEDQLATESHSSANCNSVRKPYTNLPDTPVALASASKYFERLPAPHMTFVKSSSTEQEHSHVLPKAPAVMEVHS